jgi:hypothetical protein
LVEGQFEACTQVALVKTITWTKKLSNGCIKWEGAYLDVKVHHSKFITLIETTFSNKVIII